jgi:hypothetical protein
MRMPQDTTLRVALLTAVTCSIAVALYTAAEIPPPPVISTLVIFAPASVVFLWLEKDAWRTGVGAVQDLGFFLWLAWPVVIPWYAFTSRGRRGWGLLLGLFTLLCSTYAASWLTYGVRLALYYFRITA